MPEAEPPQAEAVAPVAAGFKRGFRPEESLGSEWLQGKSCSRMNFKSNETRFDAVSCAVAILLKEENGAESNAGKGCNGKSSTFKREFHPIILIESEIFEYKSYSQINEAYNQTRLRKIFL